MAQRPLRPCCHPGCCAVTRNTWCDKHKPKHSEKRSQSAAKRHRWYQLQIWVADLRPNHLLEEPYCRQCAKFGLRIPATDVDHVIPHDGDWNLFTDSGNLQSLCHRCHSRKTMAENRQKNQR